MKKADLYHNNSEYVLLDNYKELEQQLKEAESVIEFYGDALNWAQIIDGKYNLGKIWIYADCENRFINDSMTTENGKIARQYLAKYKTNE